MKLIKAIQRFSNLSINRRGSFPKLAEPLLVSMLCLLHYVAVAQTGCPGCELMLPDSLQEDTFYLQEFPDGQFRVAYDQSVSFRLPTNTSQVLYLDASLPAGIGINDLSIKSIANLPAGLVWEPSQEGYSLPDERDGCIQICGTPLEYGMFKLEITVTAQVSILSRNATFTRNFYIAPPISVNSGFTMTNNIACGKTSVTFENNNPSHGRAGFSYFWNFDLGNSTTDEHPAVQTYEVPGVYYVDYQAIIDTIGFVLTEVKVAEVACDDFLGTPDLYIRITDPQDNLIFQSNPVDNTNPPLNFPINIKLTTGNYKLEVIDDDSGLNGGDDICGTINFNQLSSGRLDDGDLKVELTLVHPVDTIKVRDSVIVYEVPVPPVVLVEGGTAFCEGDSSLLIASYKNNNQWFKDKLPILSIQDSVLVVKESGEYFVSYTSEVGCVVNSAPVFIDPLPIPGVPVLQQESNLLSIFNEGILPTEHSLRWFQEGNLLENTSFSHCISETGIYGIELTDEATGCNNYYETDFSFDPNGICSTSAEDLSAKLEVIKIFPNPVNDQLFIYLTTRKQLNNAFVKIINSLGQEIDYQLVEKNIGGQQIHFDVSKYPAGLYWIQLQEGNNINSWKVVVKSKRL